LLGVGSNRIRQQLAQRFLHLRWKTAIHPTAYVHRTVRVGPGTVILAQSAIQPGSRLGAHVIVNTSAVIDHGCGIGDFAHVAPRACAAGEVNVGEGTLLGLGSSVLPGVSIGPWCTVGAGAVVPHDLDANVTAVGVPARVTCRSRLPDRDAA
jgi:sugar O-acyltransferase (sialic acid O-acetyltransferase NeuD family)